MRTFTLKLPTGPSEDTPETKAQRVMPLLEAYRATYQRGDNSAFALGDMITDLLHAYSRLPADQREERGSVERVVQRALDDFREET